MLAKIQKWGNSQGIRIPKSLLADVHMDVGDEVNVSAKDGSLIVTPAQRTRKKYYLIDLAAKIPDGYHTKETDWGKPTGNGMAAVATGLSSASPVFSTGKMEPDGKHRMGCALYIQGAVQLRRQRRNNP
jgi:antitoxin MazE